MRHKITADLDRDKSLDKSLLYLPGRGTVATVPIRKKNEMEDIANARRLAACWNACLHYTTKELEAGVPVVLNSSIDYRERFNEAQTKLESLMDAVQQIVHDFEARPSAYTFSKGRILQLRAALAGIGEERES